ncbi:MAG: GNAT family N-acetyltransferase [Pseudomonadota bacterium]
MQNLLLRAAKPDDASAIADVYLASRTTFLAYAPLAHSDAEVRQWIRAQLLPAASVTVADIGGEVAGFVATNSDGPLLWIDQLYVRPDAVNLGLGGRLLGYALAGVTQAVRLYTFQANAGARRFYERHGFKPLEFTDGQSNEERCPDVLYGRAEQPVADHTTD